MLATNSAIFSEASGSLRAGRPPMTGALLKLDIVVALQRTVDASELPESERETISSKEELYNTVKRLSK